MTPRIERITRDFVQVSFGGRGPVRRYCYLKRDGQTWTVKRAGAEQPMFDGFRTQKAAVAWCAELIAREATA